MKSDRVKRMLKDGYRVLVVFALTLAGFSASVPAQAARIDCGIKYTPQTADFDSIEVPDNLPIGGEIKSVYMNVTFICPSSGGPWRVSLANFTLQKSAGAKNIFETGTTGIGIKIENPIIYVDGPGYVTWSDIPASFQMKFRFTLVKTAGVVAPGAAIAAQTLFYLYASNTGEMTAYLSGVNLGPVRIGAPTCKPNISSLQVPLPSVSVSTLKTAPPVPFNIVLSCNGNKNIFITLSDLNDPGNTSDNLTILPEGAPSGVKLRILKPDGTSVKYGPDSPAAGNPGQWRVGAIPNGGAVTIPMTVQYISTGTVIGVGRVKAAATYTLSYQ